MASSASTAHLFLQELSQELVGTLRLTCINDWSTDVVHEEGDGRCIAARAVAIANELLEIGLKRALQLKRRHAGGHLETPKRVVITTRS